jgi:hypothetical protein
VQSGMSTSHSSGLCITKLKTAAFGASRGFAKAGERAYVVAGSAAHIQVQRTRLHLQWVYDPLLDDPH